MPFQQILYIWLLSNSGVPAALNTDVIFEKILTGLLKTADYFDVSFFFNP